MNYFFVWVESNFFGNLLDDIIFRFLWIIAIISALTLIISIFKKYNLAILPSILILILTSFMAYSYSEKRLDNYLSNNEHELLKITKSIKDKYVVIDRDSNDFTIVYDTINIKGNYKNSKRELKPTTSEGFFIKESLTILENKNIELHDTTYTYTDNGKDRVLKIKLKDGKTIYLKQKLGEENNLTILE